MSNNTNLCMFTGNLGGDPEVEYLPSGTAAAKVSLAVNRAWKDKDTGEKKEETTWVNLVAYGKTAEFLAEYARKGAKVLIHAQYRTRKYEEKDSGKERTWHEFNIRNVELFTWPEEGDSGRRGGRDGGGGRGRGNWDDDDDRGGRSSRGRGRSEPDDLDDDIPF